MAFRSGELKKKLPRAAASAWKSCTSSIPCSAIRGCRLGITYPEITEMQARAIFEAAVQVAKKGIKVIPEVMIPLVGFEQGIGELRRRSWIASPRKCSKRPA